MTKAEMRRIRAGVDGRHRHLLHADGRSMWTTEEILRAREGYLAWLAFLRDARIIREKHL